MLKSIVLFAGLLALVGATMATPARGTLESRRIVNGSETTIEEIPFQVSILFFNSQWCGASVLDENTLLTAAHCFDWYFDELYALSAWNARAGSSFWSTGGQVVEFASVTAHEAYNASTYNYDVAIVKLATPLVYSNSVRPVVLAQTDSELQGGQLVQVSGWGRLVHQGEIPDVLQKITLPALTRTECENLFANINPITPSMFCAGDLKGLGDSCNGDSGGPLVDLDGVQYGIVSWGLACAQDGFTGVYTHIPYLRQWIDRNSL